MPTYGDYRGFVSDLDPAYQRTLQQMLSGQPTEAQQRQLDRSRELGYADLMNQYGGRGGPAGAYQSARSGFNRDMGLAAGQMAQQNQMYGMQYGLPYMNYQADQYWAPQQMAMQRYQLQQQYADNPWYMDVLGVAGGLAGDIFAPALSRYFSNRGKPAAGAEALTGTQLPRLP